MIAKVLLFFSQINTSMTRISWNLPITRWLIVKFFSKTTLNADFRNIFMPYRMAQMRILINFFVSFFTFKIFSWTLATYFLFLIFERSILHRIIKIALWLRFSSLICDVSSHVAFELFMIKLKRHKFFIVCLKILFTCLIVSFNNVLEVYFDKLIDSIFWIYI